jgi:SAM-dependent methyltransferase
MGSSPLVLDSVVIPFVQGPKILDVGCGFGRWGVLLTTNYWETCGGKSGERPEIVGCDGHLPNVEQSRKSNYYREVHHIHFPPLPFPDSSFDSVLLLDVIEHLNDNDGRKLINESERVAAQRVVLSTPNRSALRDAHTTLTGWNPLEAHLSYWPRNLLRNLGFRLYGAGWRAGGRYWRGLLRQTNLLCFYDEVMRPTFMSLSRFFPFFGENVVGIWEKR